MRPGWTAYWPPPDQRIEPPRPPRGEYVFQEYPKMIAGPNGRVVVKDAAEERAVLGLPDPSNTLQLVGTPLHETTQSVSPPPPPRVVPNRELGQRKSRELQHERALAEAARLSPVIAALRGTGATSIRRLADKLNELRILSPRGGKWTAGQVARVVKRAAAASDRTEHQSS